MGLGIRPWLAPFRPNGKPLHVHGFLGAFERVAARNAEDLGRLAATGVPLIGLDPSMTLTYRSEYKQALPGRDLPRVAMVQEWLAARLDTAPPRRTASPIVCCRTAPSGRRRNPPWRPGRRSSGPSG